MRKATVLLVALAMLFATTAFATTLDAVEYYHSQFDHYFITADAAEIALLDGGAYGGVWKRTGESFKVESAAATGTGPVCRFFSTSFSPQSSHFYTALASECAGVKANPNWQFEANAFYVATPSTGGVCAVGSNVYRLYNNGHGGAPNHRFTASLTTRTQMLAKGWVAEGYGEGVTFCTGAVPTPTALCDQVAQVDKAGNVIFPPEAGETELPVNVDEDLGSIAVLYPGLDTTTDAFYQNMPCADEASIGGTLPAEVPPTQDEVDADDYLNKFETTNGAGILEHLLANPKPAISLLDPFKLGNCFIQTVESGGKPGTTTQVPCDAPAFLNSAMPFEGRDIIYVHGLETQHLFDRIKNPTGPASSIWPQDAAAFLNAGGYFRTVAEDYWSAHLIEHLSSPSPSGAWPYSGWEWTPTDINGPVYVAKANRYLVVAWSSNQTIEYAQHTLLTQIQLAMTTNKNVVTPLNYPAGHVRPFCASGCIIIGHSTGPLVTSSAMGRAQSGHFGLGGEEIPRHIVAHVSFDGAISGSRIATIGMAVAMMGAPVAGAANLLCPIVDEVFGLQNTCNADLGFVANSILRDLIPAVSQVAWGRDVDSSPVPTVTFAGGHPTGNQAGGITQLFLPGVDDGVVTMNSACGNPNPVFPGIAAPSGFTVASMLKAFEFSEWLPRFTRGASIMVSQRNLKALPPDLLGYLAGACTPYLSASGMVMPVANDKSGTLFDSRRRYRNHYSFIQGLAEHSYDGGGSPIPSLWPSYVAGSASVLRQYAPYVNLGLSPEYSGINVEESRAVTDSSIYTRMLDVNGTHLVKHLDMHEIRRGRKVSFNMPFNLGNCETRTGFHPILKYHCTQWIWKRTYHLADKWEQKQSSHYAYEFVGRR